MRFRIGPIPDEFTPDASWKPIKEPSPAWLQVVATPIGIGSALLVGYTWQRLGVPAFQFRGEHAVYVVLALLFSFPVLIAVHEFIHALVHPGFGRSEASIIGAWPSRLLFYAHYSGPLIRNRFLAVFIAPLLALTVLPLGIGSAGLLSGQAMLAAAWFSTWNALFACGDVIGIALIASQVPRQATVQNQSWRTYWKIDVGQPPR